MGRATALTFAREPASVVGCDVTVEPAEATVEAVRAAGVEMSRGSRFGGPPIAAPAGRRGVMLGCGDHNGAGIAHDQGASAANTVLGFASSSGSASPYRGLVLLRRRPNTQHAA